ncbi:hypothetical protein [Teredinibacter purpureus]|uniref:hypothetical protein n=1 Tax=Teredinibacter purpureus TaxID=2731756 RepID=UPI0005F77D27|nr:hypothetical protein [Teredinibacter purpureus]
MAIEFSEIVVPVISSVVTVIFVFYIKGFLSDRSAYSKLRKKLENVAGKNATIVYAGAGDIGGTLYKIIEIGKEGITIENPVHKIFLPVSQVLRLPMVLPVDDYKTIKEDYEKEQLEKVSGALFDPLFEKLEESFEQNVTQPGSEIGASIEVKVINILEEKGLLIAAPSEK